MQVPFGSIQLNYVCKRTVFGTPQSLRRQKAAREIEVYKKICEDGHVNILNPYLTITATDEFYVTTNQSISIFLEDMPRDLFHLVVQKAHGMSFPEARCIVKQLVEGVNHLHDRLGFAHLDIKLENILVDNDRTIKLCDFGHSQPIGIPIHDKNVGTDCYRAPELVECSGLPYDGRAADYWSIGVCAYIIKESAYCFGTDLKAMISKTNSHPDVHETVYSRLHHWDATDPDYLRFFMECIYLEPAHRKLCPIFLSSNETSTIETDATSTTSTRDPRLDPTCCAPLCE